MLRESGARGVHQLVIGGGIAAALVLVGPVTGAVFEPAPPAQQAALPDLREYDWTKWIVGVWEGWLDDGAGNRVPLQQTFEFVADGRHILTRLRVGNPAAPQYHGVGIFSYDPRGLSQGEWFGMLGDRNLGLGRRDGERWVWDIDRRGRERVLRVRERLGPNAYRMTNTTIQQDGTRRVTTEEMRRVSGGPGGAP